MYIVARNIVEAHGGKVGIYSEGSGHGSTFFVDIPVQLCLEERDPASGAYENEEEEDSSDEEEEGVGAGEGYGGDNLMVMAAARCVCI